MTPVGTPASSTTHTLCTAFTSIFVKTSVSVSDGLHETTNLSRCRINAAANALVFGLYSPPDCCAGVDTDSLCACRRNSATGRANAVNEAPPRKCVKSDSLNVPISVRVASSTIGTAPTR